MLYSILAGLLFTACQQETRTPDYDGFVHVVKKGQFELYIPPWLYADRHLNPRAAIAYTDSLHNSNFIIYREFIPDTEDDSITITTAEYATYASQSVLRTLQNAEIRQTDTTQFHGYEAITMRFTGQFDTLDIWYCLTVVRTEEYFFQLVGYTLKQYADTKGAQMYDAMRSFYPYI